MNPAVAHRLLNGPTDVWVAHQKDNPNWGPEIAKCLRAGTVSPLAATNNLRKLTDCMADPEIQPLLCDWLVKNLVTHDRSNTDFTERVHEGLAKCVRSLQLQAIHHGQPINIFNQTQRLAELFGNPLDTNALWQSWMLAENDIYTMGSRREYFTNGKSLGSKKKLQKTLSQYQKFVVEAMASYPNMAKKLPDLLYIELMATVDTGTMHMAHALLWEHSRLSEFHKQALAHHWAHDASPWSTRDADRLLSPKTTQQWDALALHAQTFLDICNPGLIDFHDTVKLLKTCPPLLNASEKIDDLDTGVFAEGPGVVN